MIMNNEKKEVSIQMNMMFNSIGNIIYGFSQWALVAIVTILSGYKDTGILSLATSIVAVLYSLSLYGMRVYQATDVAEHFKDSDYAFSRLITTLVSIPICIIVLVINHYNYEKSSVIFAYMIYKCIEAIIDAYHGMLQRKKRMDIIGISMTIRAILIIASFSISLLLGYSLLIACIALSVSTLCVFLFFDLPYTIRICKLSYNFDFKKQIKLLKACFPLMLAGLINNAVISIPKISLEKFTSSETLGIFSALSVPTLFITSLVAYLLSPIAVELGEYLHNKEMKKFYHIIKVSVVAIIIVTVLATAAAYYIGDFGLKVIYQKDMGQYVPQFTVLIIISGIYAVITLLGTVFTTLRWLNFMLIMHSIVLVATYFLTPIIINKSGLWGAIVATGLSALIYLLINIAGILLVRRKFENEKS